MQPPPCWAVADIMWTLPRTARRFAKAAPAWSLSRVLDGEFRVVTRGKCPASSLVINNLHGQADAPTRCRLIRMPDKIDVFIQTRPHLDGFPWFRQPYQRGHDGLHCRGLVSGQVLLLVVVSTGIAVRVPVNSRQGEVPPIVQAGGIVSVFLRYSYYAKGVLISTKSSVTSETMVFAAIAPRAIATGLMLFG